MASKTYASFKNDFSSISDDYGKFNKSFNFYNNPYMSSYSSKNYDTSGLVDLMGQAMQREQERRKGRSLLDRTFDALLVGNYASAGFVKGMVDGGSKNDVSPLEGLLQGLRAGIPLGDGYTQGEHTYSKVLGEMGWNPTSMGGKIAKGTLGFVGDVLLDPTTYLSGGASAVIKGTGRLGKAGQVTEKLSVDSAKELIQKQVAERGVVRGEEEIAKDAETLSREYNRIMGVDRQGKGLNLSLGNIPFGDKIFGKELAGKSKVLASDEAARAFGDQTFAPLYKEFRDKFYGSKIGEMFSTKTPLYRIGKENPAQLYDFLKAVETIKGQGANKLEAEKLIQDKMRLFNLSPAENKNILKLMQDKSIWNKVTDFVKFTDTLEAKKSEEAVRGARQVKQQEYDTLMNEYTDLESKLTAHGDVESEAYKKLEELKKQYRDTLIQYDVHATGDVARIQKHTDYLKRELAHVESGKSASFSDNFKASLDIPKNVTESVDNLNTAIFGGEKVIGYSVPRPLIDEVHDMIKAGRSRESIKEHVLAKEEDFAGITKAKYKYVANEMGYKDWKTEYHDKKKEVLERMLGGKGTEADTLLLKSLDSLAIKRGKLMKQFEHAHTHQQVQAVITKLENIKMAREYDEISHLSNTTGRTGKTEREVAREKMMDDSMAGQEKTYVDSDFNPSDVEKMDKVVFDHKNEGLARYDIAEMMGWNKEIDEVKTTTHTSDNTYQHWTKPENVSSIEKNGFDTSLPPIHAIGGHGLGNTEKFGKDVIYLTRDPERWKHFYEFVGEGKGTRDRLYYDYEGKTGKRGWVTAKNAEIKRELTPIHFDIKQGSNGMVLDSLTKYNEISKEMLHDSHFQTLISDVEQHVSQLIEYAKYKGYDYLQIKNNGDKAWHSSKPDKHGNYDLYKDSTGSSGINDVFVINKSILSKPKATTETTRSIAPLNDQQKDIVNKIFSHYEELINKNYHINYEDLSLSARKQLLKEARQKVVSSDMGTFKLSGEEAKRAVVEEVKKRKDVMTKEQFRAKLLADMERVKAEKTLKQDTLKVKEELLAKLADNEEKLKTLGDTRESLVADFEEQIAKHEESINTINKAGEQIKQSMRSGNFENMNALRAEVQRLDEALQSSDAFEVYARTVLGANTAPTRVSKIALDDLPYSDKVKEIVKLMRGDFMEIAKKEIEIGKLSQEQVDNLFAEYIPNLLTPAGQKFIRGNKELQGRKTGVTRDIGFGQKFNPFAKERSIKMLKIDGEWVQNPTIEQKNQYFSQFLKGDNAYVDQVADLYLSRMLKHTELVYDDMYMRTMLHDFGDVVDDVTPIKPNHSIVANYGLVKKNLSDMASLKTSEEISEDVSEELSVWMQGRGSKPTKGQIKQFIENHMATRWTEENIRFAHQQHMANTVVESGFTREMLEDLSTPMLQLTKEHMDKFTTHYNDVLRSYEARLLTRERKALSYGDDEQIKRVLASREKLESVSALQIRQVNDAIVQKANQARKAQLAKDQDDMLKLYDKFTHLMKLNQTTVMPAFHIRNKMANTFLNWLGVGRDAFSPELQRQAWKSIKNKGQMSHTDVLFTKTGGHSWGDVYEQAKIHGVIDEGFFAKDIGAGSATTGLIKKLKPKYDPTDSENFILYRKGGEWGNQIENSDRLLHFAALLKQGNSFEQAAYQAKQFLFDYSDLTTFEQQVMKRIFPFYTWMRKNSALQVEQLLEQPEKFRLVAKELNMLEGGLSEEERLKDGDVSRFAEDWIQLPLSTTNTNGQPEPILLNPNLPFQDLSRIPNPFDPINSIKALFTQSNPIIKIPTEQVSNTNVFLDSDIVDRRSDSPEIIQRLKHVAAQFAVANAVDNLATSDGADFGMAALNTFGGVKTMGYDVEGFKQMEAQKKYQEHYNPLVEHGKALVNGFTTLATRASDIGSDVLTRLAGEKPDAWNYEGALRPISASAYNALPVDKKMLYLPPSNEEAASYNYQAKLLEQKQYEESGVFKKVVWALVDNRPSRAMAHVVHVADGDTFKVDVGGKQEDVRMLLVDTPETVKPGTPAMPKGKEASDYTKATLSNQEVKLYFEGDKKDKYGRLLAYVEVGGKDYNKELLEKSFAQMRYTNKGRYSRNKEYTKAEAIASMLKRGVWEQPGYSTAGVDDDYHLDAYKRMVDKLTK
jgi:endonuclease YncB( thermonuclease family)